MCSSFTLVELKELLPDKLCPLYKMSAEHLHGAATKSMHWTLAFDDGSAVSHSFFEINKGEGRGRTSDSPG
jgi:hypothetical protein